MKVNVPRGATNQGGLWCQNKSTSYAFILLTPNSLNESKNPKHVFLIANTSYTVITYHKLKLSDWQAHMWLNTILTPFTPALFSVFLRWEPNSWSRAAWRGRRAWRQGSHQGPGAGPAEGQARHGSAGQGVPGAHERQVGFGHRDLYVQEAAGRRGAEVSCTDGDQ